MQSIINYHKSSADIYPESVTEWELKECESIAFNISNELEEAYDLYISIAYISIENKGEALFRVRIANHKVTPVVVAMGENIKELGMHNIPPLNNHLVANFVSGEVPTGSYQIDKITCYFTELEFNDKVIFSDFRIEKNPARSASYLNNLVDQYGQYQKGNWNEKIYSDTQLKESIENEKMELSKLMEDKNSTELSTYGGYKNERLRQNATGYFYAKKVNGMWSLIDPQGYPFISTGIDILRLGDSATWISGREEMFSELPPKKGQLKEHYIELSNKIRTPKGLTSGEGFNFYTANLERKYGKDYAFKWKENAIVRMKAWGFSSLGCWSDPDLFFGRGEEFKLPYVANGWIFGNHAKIPSGNPAWGDLADPFDVEFDESLNKMVQKLSTYSINEDPWCIGIFVDNEIAWGNAKEKEQHYSVIREIFKMDSNNEKAYAKRAFIDFLKRKYKGNISLLNIEQQTLFDSFDVLEKPYEGFLVCASELLYYLAEQYYEKVNNVMKKAFPNLLYLGSRLADWGTGREVVQACARHCDVVSFNCYKKHINQSWMNLGSYDKAIIIGEFHFNVFNYDNCGFFAPGLVPVDNEKQRGEAYTTYMKSVIENPNFVGAHWFQYYDQPVLGRAWDGENHHVGFVDITDRPYKELVEAASKFHQQLYKLRYTNLY